MSPRAFVCSTSTDLKDHRAHVIRALRQAGFTVDPMEEWGADADEPCRFCLERVEGCDLCVLLIAFQRGFVPDGELLSITQMESLFEGDRLDLAGAGQEKWQAVCLLARLAVDPYAFPDEAERERPAS
jgi:hypothetical protein